MPLLERACAEAFASSVNREVSNCRGDLRGIVGASDGDLDGVCIRVVVVVGDGDRVGQGDGFAGIEEVDFGVGDGVGPKTEPGTDNIESDVESGFQSGR